MSLFPPEMDKYNLTFTFENAQDDFVKLVQKVWEIDKLIQDSKNDESAKVETHPYDIAAKKDKKAATKAQELIDEFIEKCDIEMGKNKNLAYWLADMDSTLTQYLTMEMQYQRMQAAPHKPAVSNSKLDELRNDRKMLTKQAQAFLFSFPNLANDERLDKNDKGNVKLPNLQGAGSRNTDNPTGRYAKHLSMQWSVDGKAYDIGTPIQTIFRDIFTGTSRVGKKLSDLIDPIDDARKKAKDDKALITVTINGHTVSYQHVDSESDSAK